MDIPILKSLRKYKASYLPGDLIGGLLVALLLIPQGMAYAILAGVPPVWGLYAGILPTLIYGIFTHTRILNLGPTSITSLLVLGSLSHLAPVGSPEYLLYAATLTLTLGVILVLTGLLRFGFIANLLSEPVLLGYINGAGIIIVLSQLQYLLGIQAGQSLYPYQFVMNLIPRLSETNLFILSFGLGSIGLLLFFNYGLKPILSRMRLSKTLLLILQKSGPILLIILATILSVTLALPEKYGLSVIGEIPSGFPPINLTEYDFTVIPHIISGALAIAFIGLMECISTAKSLEKRPRIVANQELFAMGLSNIVSAVTSGLSVTSSISRSSVNYFAGAHTGLSSIFTALILLIIVLFFAPHFHALPKVALATIIIVSVLSFISVRPLWRIWQYSKVETLPFLITFFGVFVFDISSSLLLGIALSIALYLIRTAKPKIIELGRHNYSEVYKELKHNDIETIPIPNTVIVRIDESLYFANVQYLERYLRNKLTDLPEVKNLIIVASSINSIDASALQALEEFVHNMSKKSGVSVLFAEVKGFVESDMQKVNFMQRVGLDRFFSKTHEAVLSVNAKIDHDLPI